MAEHPITDESLPKLWGLKSCRELNLIDSEVTDRGLEHLHELSGLVVVFLKGSKVIEEGVEKLKLALPSCDFDL